MWLGLPFLHGATVELDEVAAIVKRNPVEVNH
jgi:hypothetical protein